MSVMSFILLIPKNNKQTRSENAKNLEFATAFSLYSEPFLRKVLRCECWQQQINFILLQRRVPKLNLFQANKRLEVVRMVFMLRFARVENRCFPHETASSLSSESQFCDTYVFEGRGRESWNTFRLKRGRGHSSFLHFTSSIYGAESVTVLNN